MNAGHDFWVTISGLRGEEWQRVLGTSRLPVRTPVPQLAHLPGHTTPQRVFLLALDQMSDEELEKIWRHLAQKFGLTPEQIRAEIDAVGIPILEADTVVIVHNHLRWLL